MSTTTKKKEEEMSAEYKGGYQESDLVRQTKQNLDSLAKPGEYKSRWQQSLDDVIDRIKNREKFTYDLNGDALYQQYKNQYINQGQQAMMDTMGQAAALTGGYGSSYGQSVGQQTYQGYLQQLNDKVPELYQLALDQYNREGEDLYNQYGLFADRDDTEYGRYRDTIADYNTERDYLTGRYDAERGFDYGQYRDEVADEQWQTQYDREVFESDRGFDYQKERDEKADEKWQSEFDYQKQRDETADSQWRETFDYQKERDEAADYKWEEEMRVQQEQWQKEYNESIRQFDLQYKQMQAELAEKVRSNKISEAQAAKQLELAQSELNQRKAEAANDYAYKMASIGLKTDGTKHEVTGKKYDSEGVIEGEGDGDGTPTKEPDPKPTGFTGTTYEDAVKYLKDNGVPGAHASGIRTKSEYARSRELVKEFGSYSEYLKYQTEYLIEKYN